jgi:hypothetical protein
MPLARVYAVAERDPAVLPAKHQSELRSITDVNDSDGITASNEFSSFAVNSGRLLPHMLEFILTEHVEKPLSHFWFHSHPEDYTHKMSRFEQQTEPFLASRQVLGAGNRFV